MKINLKNSPVMINFVFGGKFLDNKNNVGCELTNFLPSIDGDYFGYIVPSGRIPNTRWKNNKTFTVIFATRNAEKQKCIFCIYLDAVKISSKENIKYCGKNNKEISLGKIYEKNDDPYFKNVQHPLYVTLKCKPENVLFPIGERYPLILKREHGSMVRQSQRKYIESKDKDELQKYLNEYEWSKLTKKDFKKLCEDFKKLDDMFKKSLLSGRNI